MITEEQYKEIAKELGVEVAAIKAVEEVESKGSGFLPSGEPTILFEPHIFWKELLKLGISPKNYSSKNSDILYEKWGTKPYGKYSEQHSKLKKAISINREAALKSASWGKFQILGNNYELSGYDSLQEFINDMYESDYKHLKAFAGFVKGRGLIKHLRNKDWAKFAEGYNGSSYKKSGYHIKLQRAYEKYK